MRLIMGMLKGFIGGVLLIMLRLVRFAARFSFGFMVCLALAWAVIGGLADGWAGVLKGVYIPLLWAFVAFVIDVVVSRVMGGIFAWMASGQAV
jgi:hypothetical protein